jgi:hypothetical protein
MGPVEKWAGISVFVFGIGLASYAIFTVYDNYQTHNAPAWAAGFKSADEMAEATAAGFPKHHDWLVELGHRAALEKKRLADAADAAARDKLERDAIQRVKDEQFQEAVRIAIALRESMKNPDSFNLEHVVRTDAGALCYDYRATNSFNAIIPGHAVIAHGKAGVSGEAGFNALWAKNCAGKPGVSMDHVAYAIKNFYPRNK